MIRLPERLALEFGPLLVFFIVNKLEDIYAGTAAFMLATIAAAAAAMLREGRLPVLPLVSTGMIVVFGGLTLLLTEAWIIKIRPTVINLSFAAALLGGLACRRILLKLALRDSLKLCDEAAWRMLTWRLALYLVALAALNEIVWRGFSTDIWVAFKTFAVLPLNLLFGASQIRFVRRNRSRASPEPG